MISKGDQYSNKFQKACYLELSFIYIVHSFVEAETWSDLGGTCQYLKHTHTFNENLVYLHLQLQDSTEKEVN